MGIYFDLKYFQQLQTEFPSVEFDAEEKEPKLYVSADELLPLMHRLKENSIWAFDRMANITAVDYKEYIEMVYILYSRRFDMWLTVKVKLPEENKQLLEALKSFPSGSFPSGRCVAQRI